MSESAAGSAGTEPAAGAEPDRCDDMNSVPAVRKSAPKRRRKGRVHLPNDTVYDLTPPALGVLARLRARPRGAGMGYRDVMTEGFGQRAALRALRELDVKGYRHQFKVRDPAGGGRQTTRTYVYERPTPRAEAEAALAAELAVEGVHRADDESARDRAYVPDASGTYAYEGDALLRTTGTSLRSVPDERPTRARRARCPTHPDREDPCVDCAGDHRAGDHHHAPALACALCHRAGAA